MFVSRFARLIGVPAAECRFAAYGGELGLISRNVAPSGYSLNTGRTYLPEVEGYDRIPDAVLDTEKIGRMRRDEGYTIDAVEHVLRGVKPPPGLQGDSAFEVFAGYLVLDALVGNGDRHPGNWALLESGSGDRFLAPTYDHGSALSAGLTDTNRAAKDPRAFARRGRANPFFPGKQSLVGLACQAVQRTHAWTWLDRVSALDAAELWVTLEAPDGRLSEVASTFMGRVVLENQRRLCDGYLGHD